MTSSHPHRRSIAIALLGYSCWVIADTFLKLAGSTDSPKQDIMLIASLAGMLSIFMVSAVRGELMALKPKRKGPLVLLAILFSASYGFILFALPHLPLAKFYAIIFLAPLLISALAALVLHEPLSIKEWIAIGTAFMGVLVAINPRHLWEGSGAWMYVTSAFAGMLFSTLQMLLIRILSKTESRECLAFYPRLGPAFSCAIVIVFMGAGHLTLLSMLYALATGLMGGMGWVLVAHGYKTAPASTIAPFQYWEIIVGALLGFAIWGDVPSVHVLLGAGLIIASGIYVVRHVRPSLPPQPAPSEISS